MDSSQNNPFGSFSSGGVGPGAFSSSPMMGHSDDIVLASPPQNKSKQKITIIVLVVLIVLALVGCVLWLIGKNRGPNVSGIGKENFYKYANYVLYEKDSTEALNAEYDNEEYYAMEGLSEMNESKRKAFLLTSENLLNDFENNLEKVTDKTFLDEFSSYKESFVLVKMINTTPGLDDAGFVNQYFSLDESSLDKWVENKFSDYTNSKYELVKEYGEKGIEYYGLYVDFLDGLREEGCINAQNEFLECEDSEVAETESDLYDMRYELDETESTAIDKVVEGCFTISDMLNGKYDKKEGDE